MKNFTLSLVTSLFFLTISYSQTTIFSDNFSSGYDNWIDGGDNCSRAANPNGSQSVRLRNGTASSLVTSNPMNLTSYLSVSLSFDFETTGVDSGETFTVSYFNGISWATIATYTHGINFNNNVDYRPTISISSDSYTFASNSQFRLQAYGNDNDDDIYIDNALIQGLTTVGPEIIVTGNGSSIPNGDIYPSTTNHTDFGSVSIGNTSTKVYTINNMGTTALSISNITLSNTTSFQIVGTPYSAEVNSGVNTTFSIRYTGTSGKHSSTVTIESNDTDEGTYTFLIRGSSKATGDTGLWQVTNITSNSTLADPYEITYSPDNFLWISEKAGRIVRVSPADGLNSKTNILNLTSTGTGKVYYTNSQDGLMGFAIHPDLYNDINTSNNFVYVAYTYNAGGRKLRIARYNYIAGTGLIDSGSEITLIEGIDASNDHNSARMIIGPDLKIYYTIGDLGANQFANACKPIRAQDLPTSTTDYGTYQGKVLRLNLDGTIPSDNPTLSGIKSHVYTYGHRNTQGIIFGTNGKLYASEHGAKVDDELNVIKAGKNYGWPHIAGYYDNLAYGYCNWSSQGGSCAAGGFSDHNCPSGVTSIQEFDSVNNSILLNFEPPIGTYDSTSNYDPSGGYLTWPTVAPSSIDIYEAGLIPNWGSSLLITTLKEGTIFRAKLDATGDALENITPDNKYEEFHSSNDRYRDLAMDPDGLTFYAITDSKGDTSGPSGNSNITLANPGVVMKFKYIGPQSTPTTTYYVDADSDTFGDSADVGAHFASDPGAGYSLTNDDCDDTNFAINPNTIWYVGVDSDNDGFFGSELTATQCTNPGGYTLVAPTLDDCDDSDDTINPDTIWYLGVDNDNDGFFGSTTSVTQCPSPDVGYSLVSPTIDDCDDANNGINPGETEIIGNGMDDDCNPATSDGSLGIDDFNLQSVSIAPNPFNHHIIIKLPLSFNKSEFNIKVFDLNGRLVFFRKYSSLDGSIHVIGLNNLQQAPYLLKMTSIETGKSIIKRLIKY